MVDMLGTPYKVGNTVLVTGYGDSTLNTIAVVDKINRKTITVTLLTQKYNWEEKRYERTAKSMRRNKHQAVVIDAQLAYIAEHFPENLI